MFIKYHLNQDILPTPYLSHYITYNSIIIELFQSKSIVLKAKSDFIDFEWIEK